MNKKDRENINKIFNEHRKRVREHAGELALEKITQDEKDKSWYDEKIEELFWEEIKLYELEKEILGEK